MPYPCSLSHHRKPQSPTLATVPISPLLLPTFLSLLKPSAPVPVPYAVHNPHQQTPGVPTSFNLPHLLVLTSTWLPLRPRFSSELSLRWRLLFAPIPTSTGSPGGSTFLAPFATSRFLFLHPPQHLTAALNLCRLVQWNFCVQWKRNIF